MRLLINWAMRPKEISTLIISPSARASLCSPEKKWIIWGKEKKRRYLVFVHFISQMSSQFFFSIFRLPGNRDCRIGKIANVLYEYTRLVMRWQQLLLRMQHASSRVHFHFRGLEQRYFAMRAGKLIIWGKKIIKITAPRFFVASIAPFNSFFR